MWPEVSHFAHTITRTTHAGRLYTRSSFNASSGARYMGAMTSNILRVFPAVDFLSVKINILSLFVVGGRKRGRKETKLIDYKWEVAVWKSYSSSHWSLGHIERSELVLLWHLVLYNLFARYTSYINWSFYVRCVYAGKSLKYMVNKKGLSIEPGGTPMLVFRASNPLTVSTSFEVQ